MIIFLIQKHFKTAMVTKISGQLIQMTFKMAIQLLGINGNEGVTADAKTVTAMVIK